MNENYIMLNGKRIDLTDEQIEKLGLNVAKDCFTRGERGEKYYYVSSNGDLSWTLDNERVIGGRLHDAANYCTDESLMQQRAYHEILSRLLWRFSMQNDGDKIDWNPVSDHCNDKYYIYYNSYFETFCINDNEECKTQGTVYFYTKYIAQRAINEIILPFMEDHPDFVW